MDWDLVVSERDLWCFLVAKKSNPALEREKKQESRRFRGTIFCKVGEN